MDEHEDDGSIPDLAKKQTLDFQLDLLKYELTTIDQIIARTDGMAQTTKNWSIVTWAGALAICLQDSELRNFIGLTLFLPMLFWYLDTQFRVLQSRTTYRARKIRDWANSEDALRSFSEAKLHNLMVLDPTGRHYRRDEQYQSATKPTRVMKFGEIYYFYVFKIFISIALQVLFAVRVIMADSS